jgi:hypothetical protein
MKIQTTLFLILIALFGSRTMAQEKNNQNFVADTKIQKIAEAYASDAVDFAKRNFGITLDWSDSSIANVEDALARMHSSYLATSPRPTEEQVMSFSRGFGSYIGEVYRRNHGGEWGIVSLGGQEFPGLRTSSGTNFWPWARASNRIVNGGENNVYDYYQILLTK